LLKLSPQSSINTSEGESDMAWVRIAVALVLLMSLASCKRLEDKVVGQWSSEDQNQQVEFVGDGTATFTSYGRSVTANYKFTDSAHARFDFHSPLGELEGTQIAQLTLVEGELTLEFESGVSRSYLRVKA
jgi:hypothetical protein